MERLSRTVSTYFEEQPDATGPIYRHLHGFGVSGKPRALATVGSHRFVVLCETASGGWSIEQIDLPIPEGSLAVSAPRLPADYSVQDDLPGWLPQVSLSGSGFKPPLERDFEADRRRVLHSSAEALTWQVFRFEVDPYLRYALILDRSARQLWLLRFAREGTPAETTLLASGPSIPRGVTNLQLCEHGTLGRTVRVTGGSVYDLEAQEPTELLVTDPDNDGLDWSTQLFAKDELYLSGTQQGFLTDFHSFVP
jgi:hypothetical protein